MVSPTKTIPSRILTINAMSSDYTSSSNPSSFTKSHITLLLDLLINLSSPPLTTLMSSSPAISPEYNFEWSPSPSSPLPSIHHSPPSKIITNLSPPLIAMFAVASAAFLIVVYTRLLSRRIRRLHRRWKRWRRCRRLLRSTATNSRSQSQSPPPPPHLYSTAFPFSSDSYSDHLLSPHGLDDAAIKTLPISIFSRSKSSNRDCAVCLLEFEDGESLRTLPICSHSFHLECIDAWLRSHPTCPLCRASISFQSDSPFVPMRAARIRPSFEEIVVLEPPPDPDPDPNPPITEERCRGFLLKRSYSFGFERSFPGADRDRIVMEAAAATASPAWRLRQHQTSHHQHRGGFWSKRWPSPFGGGGGSARGFYSRPYCYRSGGGMKSPFGKRWGFAPLSGGGGGGGGRRSRSMTSPTAGWMGFPAGVLSSSRLRCGDPEALLSPERFNR